MNMHGSGTGTDCLVDAQHVCRNRHRRNPIPRPRRNDQVCAMQSAVTIAVELREMRVWNLDAIARRGARAAVSAAVSGKRGSWPRVSQRRP